MNERKEVVISDLPSRVREKDRLSTVRVLDKWETVSYETAQVTGTMLYAPINGRPEKLTLDLNLNGWYKVYVAMGPFGTFVDHYVNLKLSDDPCYVQVCPEKSQAIQEFFWRCADLTGQTLEISRFNTGLDMVSSLAWLRLVPMSGQELAAWRKDRAATDNRRLYATHDMHGQLYLYDPEDIQGWRSSVEQFRDSDVRTLALENILIFDGDPSTGDPETLGYFRMGDRNVQRSLKKNYSFELLRDLVEYGQRNVGIEMNLSMRMAAWGMNFPYDEMYFDNSFIRSHKHLRCMDRLGNAVEAASYAYPEVRNYILDHFSAMAATGCDGVEMIFTRVTAAVLFEQPVLERFAAKYPGVDPRELPEADERVSEIRCGFMTEFITELRTRLDRERAARGQKRINIVARVHTTLYNNQINGFDVETWAKLGLVDQIIVNTELQNELLDGDIWQDESMTRLDLKKYEAYARHHAKGVIWRHGDWTYETNVLIPYGDRSDPATDAQRIAQWQELEKKYGTPIYYNLMPRQMSAAEYRRRALELYDMGAQRLSLWDSYSRAPVRAQWSMASRLGHKQELRDFRDGEGELFSNHRLLRLAGQNVSMYHPSWGG